MKHDNPIIKKAKITESDKCIGTIVGYMLPSMKDRVILVKTLGKGFCSPLLKVMLHSI